jgi:hypothetical protein
MIAYTDRFAPESLDDVHERHMTAREKRIAHHRERQRLLRDLRDEDDTTIDDVPLFRMDPDEQE